MHRDKVIIGWSEYVDFPTWGLLGLPAKVDTGARTSALHVEHLERISSDRVRFEVVLSRKDHTRRLPITAPVVKWARVRSSTGHYNMRCFVRTAIRVGPLVKEIELSLVSREQMVYRMLLGRRALEHDFLVDVSKKRALGRPNAIRQIRQGDYEDSDTE